MYKGPMMKKILRDLNGKMAITRFQVMMDEEGGGTNLTIKLRDLNKILIQNIYKILINSSLMMIMNMKMKMNNYIHLLNNL